MTYEETRAWLWSLIDFERQPPATRSPYKLDRMRALLARLNNPQDAVPTIHITGSKGKGSTASIIESILRAAGYQTALYTSPHLHTERERIQLAGHAIAPEYLAHCAEQVRRAAEQLEGLTFFEAITAIAFLAFAEAAVDVAVIEVGLGGTLDATNTISRPLVSIITPISLEHTHILGDTHALIARDKAGIIKPGRPVVVAPQVEEAWREIADAAQRQNAPLVDVAREWVWARRALSLRGQTIALRHRTRAEWAWDDLPFALLGAHQLVNAATAVAALTTVREEGALTWDDDALRAGLAHVRWPARTEVLNARPFVLVDGAHNDASAQALAETLRDLALNGGVSWDRLWMVFGVSADKDVEAIVRPLRPFATGWIATQARHPRAMPAPRLAERLTAALDPLAVVLPAPDVQTAFTNALDMAGEDGAVIVTGSLFVAAEARALWYNIRH